MSKHVLTVVVALIIGVSLLLYMFAYQVRSSEVAVLLTFGKPSTEAPGPGFHLKWPWPIQEVRRFDNRVHVQEGRLEETYTLDKYNVIVSVVTGWKISDVPAFNLAFGSYAEDAEKPVKEAWLRLERIVRDRALAVVGGHSLNELVSVNRDKLQYDRIEQEILKGANEQSIPQYGVEFTLVKIRRLELPESAMAKIFDRMKAEREVEAQKIRSEGEGLAEVRTSEAESQREQIMALALSEAERIRGEGDAEAAKFYKVFAQNPDLANFLRKIRALRDSTRDNTTIILDTNTPPFDLLKAGPPTLRQVIELPSGATSAETKAE